MVPVIGCLAYEVILVFFRISARRIINVTKLKYGANQVTSELRLNNKLHSEVGSGREHAAVSGSVRDFSLTLLFYSLQLCGTC